ncbi:diguanylate cyclase [Agaribacterium sp. ZY112]|uniref:sensor domain-containing diguanylate cyclase n=1 Tax=Agaribacterium sp. ZY112 TaxID=3233574 RepID=UPI003525A8E5
MLRLSPAARLSTGLVVLTISLLIVADGFGLTSNNQQQQLLMRQQLTELVASHVNYALKRGDEVLLNASMQSAVKQHPELKSLGLRRSNGLLAYSTAKHNTYWTRKDGRATAEAISIPIVLKGRKTAELEAAFSEIPLQKHHILGIPSFILLIIFISVSGFIGFWFYIKRALKHLDPSAVVPERVRNALNILTEGVLILDKREQVVLANSSLIEHLNTSEKSLIGRKASQLGWKVAPHQDATHFPWIAALESGNKQVGIKLTHDTDTGEHTSYRVNAAPILDGSGNCQGSIAVFDDISELEEKQKALETVIQKLSETQVAIEIKNKKLSFLATRDPLTNCFNRRALYDRLEGEFDFPPETPNKISCIMADIDFFKKVNDTYGHGVGDEVIKMTADCLTSVVRDNDMVSRFGGEEFCIILFGSSLSNAQTIAERCRIKIAAQVTSGVSVTASLGISSIHQGAKSADELVQMADEALYASKKNGRDQVSTWNPSFSTIISDSQQKK